MKRKRRREGKRTGMLPHGRHSPGIGKMRSDGHHHMQDLQDKTRCFRPILCMTIFGDQTVSKTKKTKMMLVGKQTPGMMVGNQKAAGPGMITLDGKINGANDELSVFF